MFNEIYSRAEGQGRMGWILKSIADELLEEMLTDEIEGEVAEYLLLTSQVIRWVATGETDDLPDMFRERMLELEAPQAPALPVGDAMIAHS